MAVQSRLHRRPIEVEDVGDATVVRFRDQNILEEQSIQTIGQELFRIAESDCSNMVVNFAGVQSLSSTMVGKLFALHKRLRAHDKRLVLCSMGSEVRDVFEVLKVPQVCCCCPDEQQALQSF